MAKKKQTGRRSNKEGSVYKRADGKWQAYIHLGYYPNGQPKRKRFTAATERECDDWLLERRMEQRKGLPISTDRQTVAQYLDEWLLTAVKPSVAPRTYASYRQLCTLYIIPALGRTQLGQLTAQHIRRFLVDLGAQPVKRTGKPMSARTVAYTRSVLSHSLDDAVEDGLIARNPARSVSPPKRVPREARYLTPDQARTFLRYVQGERLEALYVLAISTGMRSGELLGLTWDNVNLDRGTLVVKETAQRIEGKLRFSDPKNRSAHRKVVLPKAAVAALRAHKVRQAEERLQKGARWQHHNLVFPNTLGALYDAGNMVKVFHKTLERAGLPRLNFHGLRHTCASLLLSQGTHMKVVQELLGHTDFYITMNTYSHVVEDLQREAANRMDGLLEGSGT